MQTASCLPLNDAIAFNSHSSLLHFVTRPTSPLLLVAATDSNVNRLLVQRQDRGNILKKTLMNTLTSNNHFKIIDIDGKSGIRTTRSSMVGNLDKLQATFVNEAKNGLLFQCRESIA